MAKNQAAKPKSCSCGAYTVKQHIQACMMIGSTHPYTGPK